jgi:hypothetical protein
VISFFFWPYSGTVGVRGIFFVLLSTRKMFSLCHSRCSYQVSKMFLNMFPVTLNFYPILFGCGSTFMDIICKNGQNWSMLLF